MATNFSSTGLHVSTQRIQPPLFKVEVSPQTSVGVYNIPFVASVLIATSYTTSTYQPIPLLLSTQQLEL